MGDYKSLYQRSLQDPDGFWGEAAAELHWYKPWERVLDSDAKPVPRWFVGGEFNTCYNALDRHVEAGAGERSALIYDSPVTGQTRTYSYAELRDQVAKLAGVLLANGVGKGDRVIVYMPMIPEAAIAMLACARIGAIHSVVFGGFAANELATRIDDAKPKVILSASCGIEPNRVVQYKPLLDEAIELSQAQAERHASILQRPQAEATHDRGSRPGLGRRRWRGRAGRLRAGRGDRSALHPLHLGHHRPAQGRGARQRRPRRGAALDA